MGGGGERGREMGDLHGPSRPRKMEGGGEGGREGGGEGGRYAYRQVGGKQYSPLVECLLGFLHQPLGHW